MSCRVQIDSFNSVRCQIDRVNLETRLNCDHGGQPQCGSAVPKRYYSAQVCASHRCTVCFFTLIDILDGKLTHTEQREIRHRINRFTCFLGRGGVPPPTSNYGMLLRTLGVLMQILNNTLTNLGIDPLDQCGSKKKYGN